jgi:hypothetical protein
MHKIPRISDLPNNPAVYALYGGKGSNVFVAYVGVADKLKQRISQHLIRRDSSITTGTSIVSLNPDYVTKIEWWEFTTFSSRPILEAAEKIAFDILDPSLRSRGKIRADVHELLLDKKFQEEMKKLFEGKPTGKIEFPDFQDSLDLIQNLEQKVERLEKQIKNKQE